jgi:quercetin dioxygenase-like cupin family protein
MTRTNPLCGYALADDEGQTLWSMGERMTLKATRALTNYAFTVIENLVMPGSEPPSHIHQNEDEAYYILEGEMQVIIGKDTFHVKPGSFVFLPRRVPHHCKVLGGSPARFLVFFTISAIEGFFIEMSDPDVPPVPPLIETAGRYGIRLKPTAVAQPALC